MFDGAMRSGVSLSLVLLMAACSGAPPPTSTDAVADPGNPDATEDRAHDTVDAPPDAVAPSKDDPPCDPVAPTRCGLPFPNDFWTTPDPSTPTGLRVRFREEMLPRASPRWFADFDGFSPGATLLAHLPGAVATGLVTHQEMARSLTDGSPTVLVDTVTGERVAHFAEIDVTARDPSQRALMIRPATGLVPGRRYVVALRNVRDAAGALLPPSAAFAALRDDAPSDALTAAMRARYRRIFDDLARARVPRGNLQLAWDFTVASRQSTTRRMLEMRDAALAAVGPMGPPYRIVEVRRNPREGVAMHIEGELTVPLYLTSDTPDAVMNLGPEGTLRQNGTATWRFWMLVPSTALSAPAGLASYGHGLLGSGQELFSDPAARALASGANVIVFGMDLQGMSQEDTGRISSVITGNDIGAFRGVVDRQHQGIVNALLLMRTMMGRMRDEPVLQSEGRSMIDPSRRYYYGASQGGIFGATYMTLTPDVSRGVLAVPGQSYSLMLARSINFSTFELLLRARFPNGLDVQRVLAIVQMLWDRSEPSGWTPYLRSDRVPGTPPHEVFLLVAIGDRQVTTLAAHLMARTIGSVPNLAPLNREVFGIPAVTGEHTGSAMVEFSFGLSEPLENVPPSGTPDPHGRIRESRAVFPMVLDWLRTGTTRNRCDGPCDPN
jgi:hypothetical protein